MLNHLKFICMTGKRQYPSENRFFHQSLDQLLTLLIAKETPKKTKEEICLYLSENYSKNPDLEFDESIHELLEKNPRPKVLGMEVGFARIHARDIKKEMILGEIKTIADVSRILHEHLDEFKQFSPFSFLN